MGQLWTWGGRSRASELGVLLWPVAEPAPWEPARLINVPLSQGTLEFQSHKTRGLSPVNTPDSAVPSLPPALPTLAWWH